MSVTNEAGPLSRSVVFHRLGSLLSDVSTINSTDVQIPSTNHPISAPNYDSITFITPFATLTYRQDLSTIEHVHIRCRPASSFNPSVHTCLCEAVLGIFPDTSNSESSPIRTPPVLVRGVVEGRHRRIKVGDLLLSINNVDLNWTNLNDILSKYHSARKVRLTIRHPHVYQSTFGSSLQPPITFPAIKDKKLSLPEPIDCIHGVLYYEKSPVQGFTLLYQQPAQRDLFYAIGGVFPTLTQLMHDMNEHDSLLRSLSIKLSQGIVPVCVASDDHKHYLIIIYPPIENLHPSLLEQHTQQLVRLMRFLFGSIHRALFSHSESITYFFDIFFYRFHCLLSSSTSSSLILKNVRLIDEFLPAQFGDFGTCPKLNISDQQLIFNIDNILNQLECQHFNQCSNEDDFVLNRYRRTFFLTGTVLFHRIHLFVTHLSNETTVDIYRFLIHYGHLNMAQFYFETWHLLLFKRIFPSDCDSKQYSFLIVCSQGELTLAAIIQSEYEKQDFNLSPDHDLIHQMKLTLHDIYSLVPSPLPNPSPWNLASPLTFIKKQLKRTISMPSIDGRSRPNKSQSQDFADTASLASSHHRDPSQTDFRVSQLISQPESQDELYKSNRQSFTSSALSLDEPSHKNLHLNLSKYRLHPGNHSTIFYHLDFQSVRGLLIAPYFTLDKLTQTTLIERLLFETIQQTCIYIRRQHFAQTNTSNMKKIFSTKRRPKYSEIGCHFSLPTDMDAKKKDKNLFNFWIVGKKCLHPIEHEFFVCYHDSIAQNISELAFTIGMSST